MWNPDGSEDMCGNGLRCIAALAHLRGYAPQHFVAQTLAGLRAVSVLRSGLVRAAMGEPQFRRPLIPLVAPAANFSDGNALDYSGNNFDGVTYFIAPTSDRFGIANKACSFSGVNTSGLIPDSAFRLNEFTFSIWCRPTNLPTAGNYYSIFNVGGIGSVAKLVDLPSGPINQHWTKHLIRSFSCPV